MTSSRCSTRLRLSPKGLAPLLDAERLAQRRPVLVALAGDVPELAVPGAEGGRGHAPGVLGAEARRHFAQREKARGGQCQERHPPVEHREVDVRRPSPSLFLPMTRDRSPIAIHRPEVRSATGRPGFTGPPPRSPVRLTMPPIAWNTVS